MPAEDAPVVSQWYRAQDKGEFQVTSIDEDEGTVTLQNLDGDSEEIDIDAWYEMDVEAIEPPEEAGLQDDDDDDEDYGKREQEEDDDDDDWSPDEDEDDDWNEYDE